ncbi:polysaccharide biosynthesis protein [Enterococcus lemanii]|uniref:Polysaccharide biosynthesis protein n=1 Tax=Enterococcus lemanii TaxID=1159752 RepID=A0ABV9MRF9_9ENTE|nr:nucleoside-diphosphate sugar epimerase/dehydratase [Enterococcus lemanii]MBM7709058.1 FlaA1/EpsC-like NDP-sugar epimerase [Enterococcus lemanii]
MWTRKQKITTIILVDTLLTGFSVLASYYFMKPFLTLPKEFIIYAVLVSIGSYLIFGGVFRVFTRINRYTNLKEIIAIFSANTSAFFATLFLIMLPKGNYSRRFVLFSYILSTLLIIASRLFWRLYIEQKNHHLTKSQKPKKTLVIGAGEGGRILYNSLIGSKTAGEIEIIGFIDDDPNKLGTYLSGKKILGNLEDLPEIIKKFQIEMLTLAIPSLPKSKIRQIYQIIEPLNVQINMIPSIEELASGKISASRLKTIDVVDLLGREEVQLDMESIRDQLTGKIILVTGAGGSIGSEICRQVMKFTPKKIILLGHGENSIYLIERELRNTYKKKITEIVPVIADVQDAHKIQEVMAEFKPDIVYHAAAHKHVPLMEANPRESVKNNVFGTYNVAIAARDNCVKNFVMVSTDKANNPPNVMGATKRMAEMIVTGLNESGQTKFSAVRFGNVLGSRGSVIPVFKDQIEKGGPITVTDFRMTRYFMTIPEASRLVIQSGALAKGGEIFVLDMGEPVRIVDLAKNMIRLSGYKEDEIEIIESGIRPGEKLYEELLLDKERNDEQIFEKIFVGNIKGFSTQEVMDFVKKLSLDNKELAKQVVGYANKSNQ